MDRHSGCTAWKRSFLNGPLVLCSAPYAGRLSHKAYPIPHPPRGVGVGRSPMPDDASPSTREGGGRKIARRRRAESLEVADWETVRPVSQPVVRAHVGGRLRRKRKARKQTADDWLKSRRHRG